MIALVIEFPNLFDAQEWIERSQGLSLPQGATAYPMDGIDSQRFNSRDTKRFIMRTKGQRDGPDITTTIIEACGCGCHASSQKTA